LYDRSSPLKTAVLTQRIETMNTNDLQTLEIPLSQLLAWEENVRTTAPDEDVDELAASIASVGLLSTLVVKKAPRRKYSVVGGRRRLLALLRLADNGTIKRNYPVTCRLATDQADPVELGLAENLHRPMIGCVWNLSCV
jgi:ParB family chromosome partitioning protein